MFRLFCMDYWLINFGESVEVKRKFVSNSNSISS